MKVKICLIGKGVVGTSFLQLVNNKRDELKQKLNLEVIVSSIFEHDGALINENGINIEEVLDVDKDFRNLPYWKENVIAKDQISKLEADICIETTPTNSETGEPGLTHIIEALNKHMDVISSNKGPFYLEYEKIKNLAKKNNCLVKYEATVTSCVPSLGIKEQLIGNEILSIKAILNGTSNFILSRMTAEGVDFSLALKEAQELGYAESDPTLDIEGFDAAGKIVILANDLLGWSKSIRDVKVEGITKITPHTIDLAKSDGFVIKHLAIAEDNELVVEPRLVDKYSPLNISGSLNVIELETKYAGSIILMGRGAGGLEAASALINDLLSIVKYRGFSK
ncbi:MAG: homoserine dehydrogenase [Promethearchaeota archaeon]|jgi:homoserine dehydrogenase